VGCRVYFEGENLRPYFEGHIIETKASLAQEKLRELLGKIIQDVEDMDPNKPYFADESFGFSSLYAYVALPYNTLSEPPNWFFDEMNSKKIGIIRLKDKIFANEDLKAEPQWEVKVGHPYGPPRNRFKNIEGLIAKNPILDRLFPRQLLPEKKWFKELQRRLKERDKKYEIEWASVCYLDRQNEETINALKTILTEIQGIVDIGIRGVPREGRLLIYPEPDSNNVIAAIRCTQQYFYLEIGGLEELEKKPKWVSGRIRIPEDLKKWREEFVAHISKTAI